MFQNNTPLFCARKRCVGMRVKDMLWAEQVKKLYWTKVKSTGKGPRQGGIGEKRFHPHDHQHTKPWAGIMAWAPVPVSKWIQWVTDQSKEQAILLHDREDKWKLLRTEMKGIRGGQEKEKAVWKWMGKAGSERRCAESHTERPSCMPLVSPCCSAFLDIS